MSGTHISHPVMALMACETMKPDRVEPIRSTDVEQLGGAIGVGHDVVGGEPMLFLSLHAKGGDALFARIDADEAQAFITLLSRNLRQLAAIGDPVETMN
jgi:hypothetical protein